MLKLADFLEKNEKTLSFDMRDWVKPSEDELCVEVTSLDVASKHVCGTAACAIGWARFVVNPLQEHYYPATMLYGTQQLDFNRYSSMFIMRFQHFTKGDVDFYKNYEYETERGTRGIKQLIHLSQDLFDWCFGFSWADKDNSVMGAVFRIHFTLDNPNVVPSNWISGIDLDGYFEAKNDWLKKRGLMC